MPNWVINHVVITGKEEDVERFCRRVRSMDSDFDFNKIIPMPKRLMVVDGSDSRMEMYPFRKRPITQT